MLNKFLNWLGLGPRDLLHMACGCGVMAFAIVNIHIPAQITEGGILGFSLFCYKVFGLNPSWVSPLLDLLCYVIGFHLLEKGFIRKATYATLCYALFYTLFSSIGPFIPSLESSPFLASVLGGLLIGSGCSMVVLRGAAAGGDDTLALLISRSSKLSISKSYLLADVVVLTLSLAYIPANRIIWSLLTTIISSFTIGQIEIHMPKWQTASTQSQSVPTVD
ncbi:MAG: YitT family protein [Ndongobacter sp.]|nr:YitT family protein [Ndongobacter sp.]